MLLAVAARGQLLACVTAVFGEPAMPAVVEANLQTINTEKYCVVFNVILAQQ